MAAAATAVAATATSVVEEATVAAAEATAEAAAAVTKSTVVGESCECCVMGAADWWMWL